jgi:hypothetical protein
MREIRPSGSEGGVAENGHPYPYRWPAAGGAAAGVIFSTWAALGWPGPQEPGALPGRRGRKESYRLIRIDERIESLDFTHQNPKVSRNE